MRELSLGNWIVGIGLGLVVLSATALPVAAGNGCGHLGQPCCADTCDSVSACTPSTCDPGLLCAEDCNGERSGVGGGATECAPICIACGGSFEPCCPGSICDMGSICSGGLEILPAGATGGAAQTLFPQCLPCGAPGQPCCDANTCDDGAFCESCPTEALGGDGGGATVDCGQDTLGGGGQTRGPTQCVACGQPGQPCCPGDMCDANALCGSGFCEACGQVGEQCCAEATCPNVNAVCREDVCEALPAAPTMGWTAMLSLVALLVGVGTFRIRALKRTAGAL